MTNDQTCRFNNRTRFLILILIINPKGPLNCLTFRLVCIRSGHKLTGSLADGLNVTYIQ